MSRYRGLDISVRAHSLRRLATSLVLVASLAAVGCVDSPGEARFTVGGIQKFESCLRSTFPLEPTFATTKQRIDSVGIFLQTKARIGPAGDLVYVEVFDDEEVAANLGEPVSFEYPPTRNPPVRVKLAPWESCPRTNVSLAVEGTIRFDQFGIESNDRMVGELTEATIVDARTCEVDGPDRDCEVVAETFTGSWNFPVEVAAPHRTYPTFDDDDYRVDP